MAQTIQRGKIKKAPATEVVKYLIRPAIAADLVRSYNTILDVNKAHILMLAKTGIISGVSPKSFLWQQSKSKVKKSIRPLKSIRMLKICTLTSNVISSS